MKRSMYSWDGSPPDSRDENTAVALGGGMDGWRDEREISVCLRRVNDHVARVKTCWVLATRIHYVLSWSVLEVTAR